MWVHCQQQQQQPPQQQEAAVEGVSFLTASMPFDCSMLVNMSAGYQIALLFMRQPIANCSYPMFACNKAVYLQQGIMDSVPGAMPSSLMQQHASRHSGCDQPPSCKGS